MSANPQLLAQVLMNHGQQPQSVGGMQGQSALGGAGNLLQKIAMMHAMQQQMRPPAPQSPMSGMPIQGQGAPGGIAPDQPPGLAPNFQQLLQNPQLPQRGMA